MQTCPKCRGNLIPQPDKEIRCLQCGFRVGSVVRYSPPEISTHTEIKKICKECKKPFIISIVTVNVHSDKGKRETKYCPDCRSGVTAKNARTARYDWAGLATPEITTKGTPIYNQSTGKEVKRAQRN